MPSWFRVAAAPGSARPFIDSVAVGCEQLDGMSRMLADATPAQSRPPPTTNTDSLTSAISTSLKIRKVS
jgi:hypothetical protein